MMKASEHLIGIITIKDGEEEEEECHGEHVETRMITIAITTVNIVITIMTIQTGMG